MSAICDYPSVGQYVGVSRDVTRGALRIVLYGAKNVFGLIGSEMNGIAVLGENPKRVILDDECKESSGYCGPSHKQLRRFDEIVAMDEPTFTKWVTNHPTYRGTL